MGVTPIIITLKNYIKDTVLPRIDGTGNYNHNLVTIGRDFIPLQNIENYEFPAVFILDDGFSSFTQLTAGDYVQGSSQQNVRDAALILLNGFVKVDETTDLETAGNLDDAMDKLLGDMKIALFEDDRLGGNANFGIALVAEDKSREYFDRNIGEVLLWVAVKYVFNPSDGTT